MRFAITLGTVAVGRWDEVTVEADRLGFESVWLPEHLVLPKQMEGSPFADRGHPPVPADIPVHDPFVYLGWLAARTSQIRLGTFVYNIGLRHPFVSARGATTVDVVSGGRMILGVGASWLRSEWQAVGLDFDSRGARVDEAIDICRRLWTEAEVEHHGRFFDFPPVAFEPKPHRPGGVPIHVGGDSAAAISRAARVGDGWLPMNFGADALPAAVAKLDEACRRHGREGRPEVTVTARPSTTSDVEGAAAAGADRLMVRPWGRSSQAVEAMRHFRERFDSVWT
jgi:probable F420-dependent oxidoreductase